MFFLVLWLSLGLPLLTSIAAAQPQFFVNPMAEKKVKELPAGPLYWQIENFATLAQAQAAASPTSLATEIAGKVWLCTLGPKDAPTHGGSKVADIGPVPPITAHEYLLRLNNSGGPPGATTPVHTHPGSETFYVISGRLGQRSSHGVAYVEAGQSMPGHAPGMPMAIISDGATDLNALVMFFVDATKPFSSPAKFE
jgi:mannose-6-phosphate isomerase-like protein (cupin superfamily)